MSTTSGMGNWGVTAAASCEEPTPGGSTSDNDNFTDNRLNRYSLGDRTKDLKQDADGGLTLNIQSTSPEKDKESNWLPSPQSGPFLLVLRTYMPGTEIIEQM